MKYYCNADDFFFANLFSFITGTGEVTDTLKDIQKNGLWKSIKLILLAFPFVILTGIVSMIPNFPYTTYIGVPAGLIIVSLIIGAVLNIRKYNQEYRMFVDKMMNYPINLEEEVMIYEITEQGLYFNRYNQMNKSDMMFIPWESINDGELQFLIYTNNTNSSKSDKRLELNRSISEIRKRYKDFEGTTNIFHRDKKMLILNKNRVEFEVVPIPKSWTDEKIISFVGEVEKYIPIYKK